MNLDKLKDTARRFELREEWRKAIDTYQAAADGLAAAGQAQDPSLYNRVGDLELKAGNQRAALTAYERAAHVYSDQGFFNNAIALCGKILRVDPRRTAVYLHLAELHAEKNVVAEAIRNASEYWRRMQGENRVDEAVATLRKFAARYSGSTELRDAVSALLADAQVEEEPPEGASETGGGTNESGGERGSSAGPPGATGSDPTRLLDNGLVFLDTGVAQVSDAEPRAAPEFEPSSQAPGDSLGDGETHAEEPAVLEFVEPTTIGVEGVADLPPSLVGGFEPTLLDGGVDVGDEITSTLDGSEIELLEVESGSENRVVGGDAAISEVLFDGIDVESETVLVSGPMSDGRASDLESRLAAFEMERRWTEAYAVALELSQLEPGRVFRHQKNVELAYQTGQRDLLLASYLGLADALRQLGASTNAAVVYERVLEHDPANADALSGLSALKGPTVGGPTEDAPEPESDYVDLGALILETEPVRDTRMRVEQEEPVGDEDQDFLETLAQFKEGLAANVDASDFQTHYDLGIAFKEMGLLDEAIAQFQKALNAPGGHLKSAEALGVAFFEKEQFGVAEAVLTRAIETLADAEGEKIGLLYWMGRAVEAQGRPEDAARWYERAMAVDITFGDVSDRLTRLVEEQQP